MFKTGKNTQIAIVLYIFISCLLMNNNIRANLSSLAKNDAFPVFSSLDPHTFLLTHEKLEHRNVKWAGTKGKNARLSISPFAQNADRGKPIEGQSPIEGLCIPDQITDCSDALGDLTGRTGMIALLYGPLPEGVNEFPSTLQAAREGLFPMEIANDPNAVINDATKIDPAQQFGYFSFPLKYRKRGVRFAIDLQFWDDLGANIETGVSSMRQTIQNEINLTGQAMDPFMDLNAEDVNTLLMKPLDTIAQEIELDICNFQECSIEEIRLNVYWRHAYEVNKDKHDFPSLLVAPFLVVGGSTSPGKKRDPAKFFGLPFGNNDHASVGFTGGINFDFIESIEIGGEVGYTHFFDKSFSNFFVPTSQFQTTMFPFFTDVKVSPGNNWHFAGKIASYHFLEKLSMYFQYVVVEHKDDKIALKKCDPVFLPGVLEKTTGWKTKLANIGFNYDISPNLSLGFLWQAPLSQRNTYRSTTIMFSFNATF